MKSLLSTERLAGFELGASNERGWYPRELTTAHLGAGFQGEAVYFLFIRNGGQTSSVDPCLGREYRTIVVIHSLATRLKLLSGAMWPGAMGYSKEMLSCIRSMNDIILIIIGNQHTCSFHSQISCPSLFRWASRRLHYPPPFAVDQISTLHFTRFWQYSGAFFLCYMT